MNPEDIRYIQVTNQESIDKFLDSIGYFHDSLIKEVHLLDNAFVDEKRSMHVDFKLNGQFLFQTQLFDKDFELLLIGIKKIAWEEMPEIFEGKIELLQENGNFYRLTLDEEFELDVDKIYYRFLDKSLNTTLYGQAVPDQQMYLAHKLADMWIQCSNCSATWESHNVIDKCPICNVTTIEKK
jgi:hypothetical protein